MAEVSFDCEDGKEVLAVTSGQKGCQEQKQSKSGQAAEFIIQYHLVYDA